jgi:hypothetical protein
MLVCWQPLQISKTLLNEDARLRLPRFLEDETPKDPEATKQVRQCIAYPCHHLGLWQVHQAAPFVHAL